MENKSYTKIEKCNDVALLMDLRELKIKVFDSFYNLISHTTKLKVSQSENVQANSEIYCPYKSYDKTVIRHRVNKFEKREEELKRKEEQKEIEEYEKNNTPKTKEENYFYKYKSMSNINRLEQEKKEQEKKKLLEQRKTKTTPKIEDGVNIFRHYYYYIDVNANPQITESYMPFFPSLLDTLNQVIVRPGKVHRYKGFMLYVDTYTKEKAEKLIKSKLNEIKKEQGL